MLTRRIKLKRELFQFNSEQDWINKAQDRFGRCGVRKSDYICMDANGLVCRRGEQFRIAIENDSYPIIVYELE